MNLMSRFSNAADIMHQVPRSVTFAITPTNVVATIMEDERMNTRKAGWNEWASKRASLFTGCKHGCRYCFARADALRFGRIKSAADWDRPVMQKAKHYGRCKGVVAFAGTHDITKENVTVCAKYLEDILAPGNRVLVVSKPGLFATQYLCEYLRQWRHQIEFRFTVGADDDALLHYWEPGAPAFHERIMAATYAGALGYSISYSVEPMLDSQNIGRLLVQLRPAAQSIWVGMMNQVRRRVKIETDEDRRQVERIEAGQTDERILALYQALKGDPVIRWKDSIQDVLERNGVTL